MYNGNHAAPRRDAADSGRSARRFARGASPLLLALCLVLLVGLAVGGTFAWLNATTEPVTNDMTPGKVPITIEETFDGAAKSGVTAAVILGIGRAIGEAMAVIMVAGNQPRMPQGILKGLRTLTTNIVMEMGYSADLHREALIATAVVLFVFILIINFLFSLTKRGKKA